MGCIITMGLNVLILAATLCSAVVHAASLPASKALRALELRVHPTERSNLNRSISDLRFTGGSSHLRSSSQTTDQTAGQLRFPGEGVAVGDTTVSPPGHEEAAGPAPPMPSVRWGWLGCFPWKEDRKVKCRSHPGGNIRANDTSQTWTRPGMPPGAGGILRGCPLLGGAICPNV